MLITMDETFWVATSISLILAVIYRYSKKPISDSLKHRALSISNKIAEAESLLAEAEKLLSEQRDLHSRCNVEVKNNLKAIDREIANLRHQAEINFIEKLDHKTSVIARRITNERNRLLNKLRLEAVQLALEVATFILLKQENNSLHNKILDSSMTTIMEKKL